MRTLLVFSLLSMATFSVAQIYLPRFDVQGHRGCRGLKPENTIPAFLTALDSGVTTLEMDLAVTADQKIIVSHEPWMSPEICLSPEGAEIPAADATKHNIYKMTYDEVRMWDCGMKPVARFPEQEKMAAYKPLLKDVIAAVERHIKSYTRYEVDYNIEIKSAPEGDDKFHPKPQVFCDMVYQLLDQYLPMERVVVQSFDFRVLKYFHEKYPDIRLAALVENKKSPAENLKALGFVPTTYSPEYKLLTREAIDWLHAQYYTPVPPKVYPAPAQKPAPPKPMRLRVVPWTVNEEKDMVALKGLGVDGFITDYPDRAAKYKMTLSILRK